MLTILFFCDPENNLAQTDSGSFYVKNRCETHDRKLLSSLVLVLHVTFFLAPVILLAYLCPLRTERGSIRLIISLVIKDVTKVSLQLTLITRASKARIIDQLLGSTSGARLKYYRGWATIKATSPQLLRSRDIDQLSQLRASENGQ